METDLRKKHERTFDIITKNKGDVRLAIDRDITKKCLAGYFNTNEDMERCVTSFLHDDVIPFGNVKLYHMNNKIVVILN
jgi:hypothetical protein